MTKKSVVDFSGEYLQWRRFRRTVETSGGDPFGVFVELSKVLEGDLWRTLQDENGDYFSTFSEFVRDHWKGLGMEPRDLRQLLAVRGRTERQGLLTTNPGLFDDVRRDVESALMDDVDAWSTGHGRTLGLYTEYNVATYRWELRGPSVGLVVAADDHHVIEEVWAIMSDGVTYRTLSADEAAGERVCVVTFNDSDIVFTSSTLAGAVQDAAEFAKLAVVRYGGMDGANAA